MNPAVSADAVGNERTGEPVRLKACFANMETSDFIDDL